MATTDKANTPPATAEEEARARDERLAQAKADQVAAAKAEAKEAIDAASAPPSDQPRYARGGLTTESLREPAPPGVDRDFHYPGGEAQFNADRAAQRKGPPGR